MLREDKKAGFRKQLFGLTWLFVASGRQVTLARKAFEQAAQLQRSAPVPLMQDGRRHWWWFQDRFYSEDEGLASEDVRALVFERDQKSERRLEGARSRMVQGAMETNVTPRGGISRDIKLRVWERYSGKCANCGSTQLLQFDHIVPLAMGGSNSEQNLQLLCDRCNLEKGGTLVEPSLGAASGEAREATTVQADAIRGHPAGTALFEAWQRHHDRLAEKLASPADPGRRLLDLALITNVMGHQFSQVQEWVDEATRILEDASGNSDDPRLAGVFAFDDWLKPWREKVQPEFDRYKEEVDRLGQSLTEQQHEEAQQAFDGEFEQIKDDIKAPVVAQIDELEGQLEEETLRLRKRKLAPSVPKR